MKTNHKVLFAALITITMVFAAAPVFVDEDSEALVQQNGITINPGHATLYTSAVEGHSMQFTVDKSEIPSSYHSRAVSWYLNDIDDGNNLISFSDTQNVYTATGDSVTAYGKITGSIELVASVEGTAYVASAVIYVADSPGDETDVFHFYINMVYADFIIHEGDAVFNDADANGNSATKDDLLDGTWYSVYKNETGLGNNFNAWTALQWLASSSDKNWELSGGSSGWINTFHGLGTYAGDNGSYTYWAQYHMESVENNQSISNEWVFNNTTLGYITTVDQSYIGLIFWTSPNSGESPNYPTYGPEQ